MTIAGGDLDPVLEIDAQGDVWLQGRLELAGGRRLSELHVWLWQTRGDGTGGAATAVLLGARFDSAGARNSGGARWRTRADAVHGELRAGPATATALAVLTRQDGSVESHWWSDSAVRLTCGAPARSPDGTLDLSRTLSWKTAAGDAAAMLDELQSNIVHPHVREHLSVLLLRFGNPVEGRTFLRAIAPLVKSARQHLREVEEFRATGTPGTPYVGIGLTHAAYRALGVGPERIPGDASFTRGMKDPASRDALHDPPVSTWEPPYREEIHAVVLIGDATQGGMSAARSQVLNLVRGSTAILGRETGLGRRNASGAAVEHFGYVDGISQPLFLDEDVAAARRSAPGGLVWDPACPLDRVLVPDPAAPDPAVHYGSYLVFRKLEQDVRRFQQAGTDLAQALGLARRDRERAGAMLVGRFRDGTPLTLRPTPGPTGRGDNDFDYAADAAGRRCPFQAHIRKVNPRGSAVGARQERVRLMARRGQTYGRRTDDLAADLPPSRRPTGGVGLLFMAFNAEPRQQFDFVQSQWANDARFPGPARGAAGGAGPGRDPVVGQGPRADGTWPPIWDAAATRTAPAIPQAVTLKGGEYFFMPSLAFLRSL
ncbi:Dyp-type peroxidase [Geodermatophilus sp. URMC 62]|uniref:Dyp-type peroxidase n=1 Tax=Geodermatophilus sp. URMC 62 TaxID=3423414 RepID=UPI00406CE2B5